MTPTHPWGQVSPRLASLNKWARIEAIQRNKAFLAAYHAARDLWQTGMDALFRPAPTGSAVSPASPSLPRPPERRRRPRALRDGCDPRAPIRPEQGWGLAAAQVERFPQGKERDDHATQSAKRCQQGRPDMIIALPG